MSNAIKVPAARQPATEIDDRGVETFTRPWLLFFQQLYERVGGAIGESTTDLNASLFEDAGMSETNATLFAVEDAANQAPLPVPLLPDDPLLPVAQLFAAFESLAAEVAANRDQIAELTKELDSLKQGAIL